MKRGNFAYIGILFLFILVIAGIFWISSRAESTKFTIEISPSGFSPSTIEIPKGSRVTFVNRDATEHWPASNVHPTHQEYPNSGIDKCGTSQQSEIFDSCEGLKSQQTYSFVFNEIGTWNYHDHLHPDFQGKIIVK